jgi:hypothetical protein
LGHRRDAKRDAHRRIDGSKLELRHFLESIVLQSNSELTQSEEPTPDARDELAVDEAAQADRQMAATFRAFADE